MDRAPWLRGLLLPGLAAVSAAVTLGACASPPETVVEPPLPKPTTVAQGPTPLPGAKKKAPAGKASPSPGPALAPLATPQQVVRSVDVGRPDPFSAVFSPLEVSDLTPRAPRPGQGQALSDLAAKAASRVEAPKGLQFQGVLQGPRGVEALVEYTPEGSQEGGVRAGSLRVGDVGSGRVDSLLPAGWRVRAIDGLQGVLVLQKDGQPIVLNL